MVHNLFHNLINTRQRNNSRCHYIQRVKDWLTDGIVETPQALESWGNWQEMPLFGCWMMDHTVRLDLGTSSCLPFFRATKLKRQDPPKHPPLWTTEQKDCFGFCWETYSNDRVCGRIKWILSIVVPGFGVWTSTLLCNGNPIQTKSPKAWGCVGSSS